MIMNLEKIKDIRIAEFDYPLADEKIARHPLAERDQCKLLVSLNPGETDHRRFAELPGFLSEGGLLIFNDTRVINARIRFQKETGSTIEVFLLEPLNPEDYVLVFQTRKRCTWSCMVGNLKRWKGGQLTKKLQIDGREVTLTATRGEARPGNAHEVTFEWDDPEVTFASIVEAAGYIPIPPYLKRDSEASDADDYQTVYARVKGSVAAPTAGLHFTPAVFEELKRKGIESRGVTLHVGAGTFQPVKSDEIGGHPMHTEVFNVERGLVTALIDALETGREITAVGTTSVRTLESLPYIGRHLAEETENPLYVSQWEAYEETGGESVKEDTLRWLRAIVEYMDGNGLKSLTASTSIMIAPGFRWRIVEKMVTNFHQPQSTLLLLVSSFLDPGCESTEPRWRSIYREAVNNNYRFLSYGDACLFKRGE